MMAEEDPGLLPLLAELDGVTQAALDLHLTGKTVIEHSAEALPFGTFVARFAEAVKEVAKRITGARSMHTGLMASFAPGSIRVTFTAPEPDSSTELAGQSEAHAPGISSESQALRQITAILSESQNDSPESPLSAELAQLSEQAKVKLRAAVKPVLDSGWNIEGEFTLPGTEPTPLNFSTLGALHIIKTLDVTEESIRPDTIRGFIDGHRRSLGSVWIVSDKTGRSVNLAVTDDNLYRIIASLDADEQRVEAEIEVRQYKPEPGSEVVRTSRKLLSIKAIDVTDPIPGLEL